MRIFRLAAGFNPSDMLQCLVWVLITERPKFQPLLRTEEHRILSARNASLVGKQQRFISSYEEAFDESQSAKLLVLTLEPDDLLIKVIFTCKF